MDGATLSNRAFRYRSDGGEAQANERRRSHVASGIMCITHRYLLPVSLCWLEWDLIQSYFSLSSQLGGQGHEGIHDDMVLDKVLLRDFTEMEGKRFEVYKHRSKANGACARVRACSARGVFYGRNMMFFPEVVVRQRAQSREVRTARNGEGAANPPTHYIMRFIILMMSRRSSSVRGSAVVICVITTAVVIPRASNDELLPR